MIIYTFVSPEYGRIEVEVYVRVSNEFDWAIVVHSIWAGGRRNRQNIGNKENNDLLPVYRVSQKKRFFVFGVQYLWF